MKNFFNAIVAPLVVAGVLGGFAVWMRIEEKISAQSERLARIETKLDNLKEKNYANYTESSVSTR